MDSLNLKHLHNTDLFPWARQFTRINQGRSSEARLCLWPRSQLLGTPGEGRMEVRLSEHRFDDLSSLPCTQRYSETLVLSKPPQSHGSWVFLVHTTGRNLSWRAARYPAWYGYPVLPKCRELRRDVLLPHCCGMHKRGAAWPCGAMAPGEPGQNPTWVGTVGHL